MVEENLKKYFTDKLREGFRHVNDCIQILREEYPDLDIEINKDKRGNYFITIKEEV